MNDPALISAAAKRVLSLFNAPHNVRQVPMGEPGQFQSELAKMRRDPPRQRTFPEVQPKSFTDAFWQDCHAVATAAIHWAVQNREALMMFVAARPMDDSSVSDATLKDIKAVVNSVAAAAIERELAPSAVKSDEVMRSTVVLFKPKDQPAAVPLPEAHNLHELYRLVCSVKEHLGGMTADWWCKHHFKPLPPMPGVVGIINAEAKAAWHRRKAANEYRDALRSQAMRLWKLGLLKVPAEIDNGEADITKALIPWLMDALSSEAQPSATSVAPQASMPTIREPAPQEKADITYDATHCFRMRGNVWEVRFDGESGNFTDLRGFGILCQLLRFPNRSKPLTAAELLGRNVYDAGKQAPDEILDGEARKEYRDQIAEYDQEIEQANESDDIPKVESLKRERQEVMDHLNAATGLGGKSRLLGSVNPDKSARNTVRNAITRVRDVIAKTMPVLAIHLKESIEIGEDCVYRPNRPIVWELD